MKSIPVQPWNGIPYPPTGSNALSHNQHHTSRKWRDDLRSTLVLEFDFNFRFCLWKKSQDPFPWKIITIPNLMSPDSRSSSHEARAEWLTLPRGTSLGRVQFIHCYGLYSPHKALRNIADPSYTQSIGFRSNFKSLWRWMQNSQHWFLHVIFTHSLNTGELPQECHSTNKHLASSY